MKFYIKNTNLKNIEAETVVLGVFSNFKISNFANQIDDQSNGYLSNLLKTEPRLTEIENGTILYNVPFIKFKKIILVGCGYNKTISNREYKKIICYSLKLLKTIDTSTILYSLINENISKYDFYWKIRIFMDIAYDTFYTFNKFKKNKSQITYKSKNFYFFSKSSIEKLVGEKAIKHSNAISMGKNYTKNLANSPPNVCNPAYLVKSAKTLQKKYSNSIQVSTLNTEKMKKLGMNAYLSVGNGSANKPYMSIIKYSNKNVADSIKPIILLGKGITFDTGGISIKPSYKLDEMKYDMCGAAAVYGTMVSIAQLQLPINVIGILAGSENMPDGKSFRPGDILKTMSGKTIEIIDTDAEGRLILCDALTYLEKYNPEIVIDIATLTGACVVALGNNVSGLMSKDKILSNELITASKQTEDRLWQFPMFHEYYNELKSNIADLRNVGHGSAGAITAACFLSYFANKYRWAHIDIAGTAWSSEKERWATGRPVNLLVQFLLNKCKEQH